MTIYRGDIVPGTGDTARGSASDIDIVDAGSIIAATNVEDALQENRTAIDADEAALAAHIADTSTHGTTGDIVGTSDTQTLTNKTLTSPDINGGTADALTSLTVAADSSSNVSHYAMGTATSTATQYAKLATISYPATNNVSARLTLLLTPKSAGGAYSPVLVMVDALQGTGGLSSSAKIEVLSTDGAAVAYDDLFLDTATASNGTDIDLWMQSIIAAVYDVQVLAESYDTGVSLAWNDGATWTASAPAGATTVTSDFGGAAGVVESGSNANGEYVMFADGTMICNVIKTRSSASYAAGSITAASEFVWTFPATFISVPSVASKHKCGWVYDFTVGHELIDSSSASSAYIKNTGSSRTTGISLHLIAQGKWK
jgi:hypothetical protein